MNAKIAKKIADKNDRVKSFEINNLSYDDNVKKILQSEKDTINKEVNKEIKYILKFIKEEAKKGRYSYVTSHPGNEKFLLIKSKLEKKGFFVKEYSTDEGYCIGDMWHMEIRW